MATTRTSRLLAPSFLAPALTGALLAVGTLSACGGSAPSAGPSTTPSPAGPSTSSPTVTATPSPTATATSASPSVTAAPSTPAPPRTLGAALLTASELPRPTASTAWSQGATGPAGTDAFGLCQKFDLLTIGAERAVQRTFTAASGDTAGQQVAAFPDAQNAARAGSVLEAWHRDCAGRVAGTHVQVQAITPVATSSGTAWWYLVSYQRGGQAHQHAFGMVLEGSRMTLLAMDSTGQGRHYPTGHDPVQLAVQAAAAKLA